MKTLKDRVAVVTGAGSGIGRATSVALAKRGCNVALCDIQPLDVVVDELTALGVKATAHHVDVSDRARMLALPAEVIEAHGAVHVVINNAGVTVTKTFDEHTLEDWDWLIGVNLWGVIYGCHVFMPHLREQDEAHIVNISSIFGVVGIPAQSSYCAAKFAVRGLSESLWEELRGSPIGLTVVHPGGVNTNIIGGSRTSDEDVKARASRFFQKHTLSADVAGEQIVRAIEKNQPRLLITKEAPLLDLMKRIAPVYGNKFAAERVAAAFGLTRLMKERLG